jgi:type IV pilus assembly protein PilF
MFRNLWRPWASIIIAALLTVSCATSHNKEEAQLHLEMGSAFLQTGRYPEALRELLLAEKADPTNAIVQNNLGLVYFIRERNEIASKHLQKAVDLKSDYTEARNNWSRVLIELGQYDKAISELRTVLRDLTYSDTSKAYTNMGLAYFRRGQYTEAKKQLSLALKVNRENCLAYTLFGRSQLELGDTKNAASSLDSAVVLCQQVQFDEPHYFAGLAYNKLGDREKAIARLEEVVRLYPSGKYNRKAQDMLNSISKQVQ